MGSTSEIPIGGPSRDLTFQSWGFPRGECAGQEEELEVY